MTEMPVGDRESEFPEIMEPARPWPNVNEPQEFFRGRVSVQFGKVLFGGDGVASLVWLPRPAVILRVEFDGPIPDGVPLRPDLGLTRFEVAGGSGEGRIEGGASFAIPPERPWVALRVFEFTHETSIRTDTATEVRFDLANFDHYYGRPVSCGRSVSVGEHTFRGWQAARMQLEGAGWEVTIDSRHDLHEVTESLRQSGGHALTHTCRARRTDGVAITPESTSQLLSLVQFSLSIGAARWVTPVLAEGLGASGEVLWTIWTLYNTEPWTMPLTVFSGSEVASFEEFFRRLAGRWSDAYWESVLRTATHYYLRSVGGDLVHEAIIMGNALLELIGWAVVVEERALLSANGFDRLPWDDKVRMLLGLYNCGTSIPPSLTALRALGAREGGWDGPRAVTEMRHSAVHAKKHQRGWAWGNDAWGDALHLTQWYCDLAILALVGFEGRYVNRVSARSHADLESVPWATRSEAP